MSSIIQLIEKANSLINLLIRTGIRDSNRTFKATSNMSQKVHKKGVNLDNKKSEEDLYQVAKPTGLEKCGYQNFQLSFKIPSTLVHRMNNYYSLISYIQTTPYLLKSPMDIQASRHLKKTKNVSGSILFFAATVLRSYTAFGYLGS